MLVFCFSLRRILESFSSLRQKRFPSAFSRRFFWLRRPSNRRAGTVCYMDQGERVERRGGGGGGRAVEHSSGLSLADRRVSVLPWHMIYVQAQRYSTPWSILSLEPPLFALLLGAHQAERDLDTERGSDV